MAEQRFHKFCVSLILHIEMGGHFSELQYEEGSLATEAPIASKISSPLPRKEAQWVLSNSHSQLMEKMDRGIDQRGDNCFNATQS